MQDVTPKVVAMAVSTVMRMLAVRKMIFSFLILNSSSVPTFLMKSSVNLYLKRDSLQRVSPSIY